MGSPFLMEKNMNDSEKLAWLLKAIEDQADEAAEGEFIDSNDLYYILDQYRKLK